MESRSDDDHGSDAAAECDLRQTVALEMESFLESVPEADLVTLYRTLVGLVGAHIVPYIAESISSGLRRGVIAMETRGSGRIAPPTVFVRRTARGRPVS